MVNLLEKNNINEYRILEVTKKGYTMYYPQWRRKTWHGLNFWNYSRQESSGSKFSTWYRYYSFAPSLAIQELKNTIEYQEKRARDKKDGTIIYKYDEHDSNSLASLEAMLNYDKNKN